MTANTASGTDSELSGHGREIASQLKLDAPTASGRSHRHVGAIADHLLRALKDAGQGKAKVEGLPHCDWVLIDAGDVVVHLFRPEVRSFYNIEKIWSVDSAHRAASL